MKLTRQEMMQYKDLLENLEPGDQTYTFHCKQGDQNDRLNIKFDSSGEYYLFHCLHCGAGGRLNSRAHSATARLQRPKRYPEGHVSKFVRLPEDLRIAGETWDVRATHWVKQYGITDEELLWNGIGYSPSRGRVILPVYRETELQGYLERKIFDEDPGPKYIERRKPDTRLWKYIEKDSDTVVLVEDYLSCVKVSRVYACIALLGVQVNDEILSTCLKYNRVVIFLDNDNAKVKSRQLQIRDQVQLLGKEVQVIQSTDPKKLSDDELRLSEDVWT